MRAGKYSDENEWTNEHSCRLLEGKATFCSKAVTRRVRFLCRHMCSESFYVSNFPRSSLSIEFRVAVAPARAPRGVASAEAELEEAHRQPFLGALPVVAI